MIVEIYLAFTLIGGVVKDVDAFVDRDACLVALALSRQHLETAKRARPEFAGVTLVGCVPTSVEAPKAPAEATQK